ncbi:orotate phosphoribosyltransferase [Reinekea sp. MED297]|uniref:Orotate phosphoribosyltransferase n=1 Tax=Reinekea blandensis MED297 TaxID=314283 RepID=A4B9E5_9GAMM|nr:orotate phosphoribosyltransferase [Reinekea sp. MED297] [Reinekea blandensis MED297]
MKVLAILRRIVTQIQVTYAVQRNRRFPVQKRQ